MHYIYLHGFASSAQSYKGTYLRERFAAQGITLALIDFNQNNFQRLTLTRQIHQVETQLIAHQPTTIIGSSFGGLTAAWVAERQPQVERLVLLAPAFQFWQQWVPKLSSEQAQSWRAGQPLSIYHYGYQQLVPLDYQFLLDLQQYDEVDLQRAVPTLVLHGQNDEVIGFDVSRNFTELRSWVSLCPLRSDHSLTNVIDQIWQQIQTFCKIK
ncbi:alpha/beta fold hydrolase [filamentous cyanobacterium LEGE 11480]|uniref:Alpha/beta fold hydrolase n=1 Tax=Romeriopsis navalis LEGE 11480 TaxID=2777977 RepID=A0A928VUS8_9CYAN|nr:YqiA/YcfP family alpha/beta fold hydrolase [Romeriopsis navalis]MBE9032454.1 alpha/beta fold hydrolase [Romeriopsis navalis LEGE 11480]